MDNRGARRTPRKKPPVHGPPPSPPTITRIPLRGRARRSCDNCRRPAVSTITSQPRWPSGDGAHREGALDHAPHLAAGPGPGDCRTDPLDTPAEAPAPDAVLRFAEPD